MKINMRLGIYVGSFNPVHNGHLKVIHYLLDHDLVDKVFVLATPNYWDKQDLACVDDRVAMLKFFEDKNIIIDTIHNNYPYTYQVLESIKKDYKDDELFLILGSDNIIQFHKWKNLDIILKYNIIVFKRGEMDISKYLKNFDNNKIKIIDDFKYLDVSSTNIRNGSNDNLDKKVINYINKKKLYGR